MNRLITIWNKSHPESNQKDFELFVLPGRVERRNEPRVSVMRRGELWCALRERGQDGSVFMGATPWIVDSTGHRCVVIHHLCLRLLLLVLFIRKCPKIVSLHKFFEQGDEELSHWPPQAVWFPEHAQYVKSW